MVSRPRPSLVPLRDDDDAALETEKDMRKRIRLGIMHDASPVARHSMPIENQTMFTAMGKNHEKDGTFIATRELVCSESDVIKKSDECAYFLCDSLPITNHTILEQVYGAHAESGY